MKKLIRLIFLLLAIQIISSCHKENNRIQNTTYTIDSIQFFYDSIYQSTILPDLSGSIRDSILLFQSGSTKQINDDTINYKQMPSSNTIVNYKFIKNKLSYFSSELTDFSSSISTITNNYRNDSLIKSINYTYSNNPSFGEDISYDTLVNQYNNGVLEKIRQYSTKFKIRSGLQDDTSYFVNDYQLTYPNMYDNQKALIGIDINSFIGILPFINYNSSITTDNYPQISKYLIESLKFQFYGIDKKVKYEFDINFNNRVRKIELEEAIGAPKKFFYFFYKQ
jgi:hypothetical protein